MKQGTLELAFLSVAFLALQVWWITMTIKNSHNEKVIDITIYAQNMFKSIIFTEIKYLFTCG